MTNQFNAEAAKRRYEMLDDAALSKIAYSDLLEYDPLAVSLAREELACRGVTGSEHAVVMEAQRSEAREAANRINGSLHPALRALCFAMPGLATLAVAIWHFASGQTRAGKEALLWSAYGLLAWCTLGAVLRAL